jgi:type II restriction enzyme
MRLSQYLVLDDDARLNYFMNNLSVTNRTAGFYINWDKVYENTEKVEQYLHTLNFLIGKEDIEAKAKILFIENPQLLRAIPYLLATRDEQIDVLTVSDDGEMSFYNLDFINIELNNINKYIDFISESGLFDFIKSRLTNNLVDFVYGVEAGLDSNARKNRSGTMMESLVEKKVALACEEYGLEYTNQGTPSEIRRRWGFNVPLDKSSRRYDFAIYNKHLNKLYLIETNFYGGGGSKLKSVAGEFVTVNNLINTTNENIEFIWVTDGYGWTTARIPLSEAFSKINNIFNLKMLNDEYLNDAFNN